MEANLRKAIVFLIVLFALLSVASILTQSLDELWKSNIGLFAISALFYLASIQVWILSWTYLVKKAAPQATYKGFSKIGWASVYGSLTPVQLGTEALRGIQAKHYFGIRYRDSISCSFMVKGLKLLVLLIVAFGAIVLLFSSVTLEPALMLAFLSGLAVVFFAVLLFLLPLNERFGSAIARFFYRLGKRIRFLSMGGKFFESYSSHFSRTTLTAFFLTFVFAAVSFLFEMVALHFAFEATGITLGFRALAVLMVLIGILERTPFLPRGIGIVELVAVQFVALSHVQVPVESIVAAVILFDLSRLVIPALVSIGALLVFGRGLEHKKTQFTLQD